MMMRALAFLAFMSLLFSSGFAETTVPQQKAIIDLLAANKTTGWSSQTLPDGRPVALYRGPEASPATLALSCLPTGEIVVAGDPGRFLTVPYQFDKEVEIIVPIMGNHVMSRGVVYLVDSLSIADFAAAMDGMPKKIPADPAIVSEVGNTCKKLIDSHPEASNAKTSADIVWTGWRNEIRFGTLMGDDYLPLDLACEDKALKINYFEAPKDAKNNQTTTLLIHPGRARFNINGKIEIQTDGMGLEITHAIDKSPSALLSDLSNEEAFGIGWHDSLKTVFPTSGLSYLIQKHLSECR